jgi:hypothetical protein
MGTRVKRQTQTSFPHRSTEKPHEKVYLETTRNDLDATRQITTRRQFHACAMATGAAAMRTPKSRPCPSPASPFDALLRCPRPTDRPTRQCCYTIDPTAANTYK